MGREPIETNSWAPGELVDVEIHEASSQTLRGEEKSFLLARAG